MLKSNFLTSFIVSATILSSPLSIAANSDADNSGQSQTVLALYQALQKTESNSRFGWINCSRRGAVDSIVSVLESDDDNQIYLWFDHGPGLENLYLYFDGAGTAIRVSVQPSQPLVVVENHRRGVYFNEDYIHPKIGDVDLTGEFYTTANQQLVTKIVFTQKTYVNVGTISQPRLSTTTDKLVCIPLM